MISRAWQLAIMAIGLAFVGPAPAHAQTFQCTQAVAGQLSNQAGVRCMCKFFHASALRGTPAGYRWDCGILRPRIHTPIFEPFHGFHPIVVVPEIRLEAAPQPAP